MFGRKNRNTASAIPSHQDDNRRLKTGERVTILGRTPDGAIRVAFTDKPYPCDDIVSADDIRPV